MLEDAAPEGEDRAWVEVVAVYCGETCDVQHVGRGRPRGEYTIGEAHAAAFQVPGVGSVFRLVCPERGWALRFSEIMDGDVEVAGERVPLARLIAERRTCVDGEVHRWPLREGRCRVRLGAVEFLIRRVEPETARIVYDRIGRSTMFYQGMSLFVLGGLLLLARMVPRAPGLVMNVEEDEARRFVGYLYKESVEARARARRPEEMEGEDAVVGAPHVGPQGAMGRATAKRTARRVSITLKGGGVRVAGMGRGWDPEVVAREAGVLALISGEGGPAIGGGSGIWGDDDSDVWGGLTGAEVGERYGVGGLGLVGTGRGGAGAGEGVVGLDAAGLIGKGCACHGIGGQYVRDGGVGFGGRGTRAPRVHQARAEVQGGLEAAVVRRVVRRNLNELRYCYDQALTRDPREKGRVTVEFLITEAGQVGTAVVGESGTRDAALGQCVARAVKRWRFPRSHGGTLVTHPFTFEPVR